jgi:hypothetical protein
MRQDKSERNAAEKIGKNKNGACGKNHEKSLLG